MPPRLQVTCVTATLPAAMAEMMTAWAADPVRVQADARGAVLGAGGASAGGAEGGDPASAGSAGGPELQVPPGVTQTVHVCAEHKKPQKLIKYLTKLRAADTAAGKRQRTRVLVFANRIKAVDFIATSLAAEGHRAMAIHGDKSQPERDRALAEFKARGVGREGVGVGGRGERPALIWLQRLASSELWGPSFFKFLETAMYGLSCVVAKGR